MALASITIVSDLPLPCVCQTTPPSRRPVARRVAESAPRCFFTVKYCW